MRHPLPCDCSHELRQAPGGKTAAQHALAPGCLSMRRSDVGCSHAGEASASSALLSLAELTLRALTWPTMP